MPDTTVTLTTEQFAELLSAATSNSGSAEEAAVATKQVKPTAKAAPLAVAFDALEGADAEKYGDVRITKLLPNGQPRKSMVLRLDDAARMADFVLENFADRL